MIAWGCDFDGVCTGGRYDPETDQWTGSRITLYPAKVRAFGATVDCIRVKPEIPRHHPAARPDVPVVEAEPELDDPEDLFDHDDEVTP